MTCLECGCSRASSSCSCLAKAVLDAIETSLSSTLLVCFLRAKWPAIDSVDVMYMVTMTTHMSMQFKNVCIAEAVCGEDVEFTVVACSSGMLSGPSVGNSRGGRAAQWAGRGGDQIPGGGMPVVSGSGGSLDGAGPSRWGDGEAGRVREPVSSSEED